MQCRKCNCTSPANIEEASDLFLWLFSTVNLCVHCFRLFSFSPWSWSVSVFPTLRTALLSVYWVNICLQQDLIGLMMPAPISAFCPLQSYDSTSQWERFSSQQYSSLICVFSFWNQYMMMPSLYVFGTLPIVNMLLHRFVSSPTNISSEWI